MKPTHRPRTETADAPPLEPDRIGRSPSPRRFQSLIGSVAALACFPGLYAVILRVFPPTTDNGALIASFIPYGIVFSSISLLCFLLVLLRARRRGALGFISLLAAAVLAWQISWQVPLFVPDHRPMTTAPITVISLNLHNGGANQEELAAEAANADIVVLVEMTPQMLRDLRHGPMSNSFPYRVPNDQRVEDGSAILSRFPLSDARALPPTSWRMWSAVAAVPAIGNITVVGAHPCNPLCGQGKWAREHDVLERFLTTLHGPVIVAGDFNAVDDHAPMRQLAADGYESATNIAGAGWLPTYPSHATLPPLIPIDHILLNDRLTASSVTSFAIAGTDHRGLRAVIGGTR